MKTLPSVLGLNNNTRLGNSIISTKPSISLNLLEKIGLKENKKYTQIERIYIFKSNTLNKLLLINNLYL